MSAAIILTLTAMGYTLARSAHIQHNPADYDTVVKADPIVKAMDTARPIVAAAQGRADDARESYCRALTPGQMDGALAIMRVAQARADGIRTEWAAYLYSRYCGNGSIPMPTYPQP